MTQSSTLRKMDHMSDIELDELWQRLLIEYTDGLSRLAEYGQYIPEGSLVDIMHSRGEGAIVAKLENIVQLAGNLPVRTVSQFKTAIRIWEYEMESEFAEMQDSGSFRLYRNAVQYLNSANDSFPRQRKGA